MRTSHWRILIVEPRNVLAPSWRHQFIGITTDSASVMTGCVQGTCSRLSNACHGNIFQIWCGAHQLDLLLKKAFNELMDMTPTENLSQEMNSACPTYVTNHWISMGKVLKWLKAIPVSCCYSLLQRNEPVYHRRNGSYLLS